MSYLLQKLTRGQYAENLRAAFLTTCFQYFYLIIYILSKFFGEKTNILKQIIFLRLLDAYASKIAKSATSRHSGL